MKLRAGIGPPLPPAIHARRPAVILTVRSHDFSDRWSGSLRGEAGGFGFSSDISWQALAFVGYRFNANSQLVAGWRYLNTD